MEAVISQPSIEICDRPSQSQ